MIDTTSFSVSWELFLEAMSSLSKSLSQILKHFRIQRIRRLKGLYAYLNDEKQRKNEGKKSEKSYQFINSYLVMVSTIR